MSSSPATRSTSPTSWGTTATPRTRRATAWRSPPTRHSWPTCAADGSTEDLGHGFAGADHQRAVGRLGAGEVEHHRRRQRGAPAGVAGELALFPGRGAELVVVAVAPLVEDHPPRRGEQQLVRAAGLEVPQRLARGLAPVVVDRLED